MSLVRIDLNDDAQLSVCGFGLPFSNPDHDADAWINRHAPIAGDLDLVSLLRRRTFNILVARNEPVMTQDLNVIAEPFRFPYGEDLTFDVARFGESIEANMVRRLVLFQSMLAYVLILATQGGRWLPTFSFDRDEDSVCVNALSQFIDVYWLNKAAATIRQCQTSAYFVQNPTELGTNIYYAVIRIEQAFKLQFADHWSRLIDEATVSLHVCQDWTPGSETRPQGGLFGRILDRPDLVPVLKPHRLAGEFDTTLFVKVKSSEEDPDALKTFAGRGVAEEQYKVCNPPFCLLANVSMLLTSQLDQPGALELHLAGLQDQSSRHATQSRSRRLVLARCRAHPRSRR